MTIDHKSRLRAELKQREAIVSSDEFEKASKNAVERLTDLLENFDMKRGLVYRPIKDSLEIDLSTLDDHFKSVRFDVLNNTKDTAFPAGAYDVIILPLFGFSEQGYRLGRGGGWYDKFLLTQPQALKVGIGLESSLVDFAAEAHDAALDFIVTENQTRAFK